MSFKTSVSVKDVSSNPGVSIKMICCRPIWKGNDVCTSLVQLSKPEPSRRLEPDARLMNWKGQVSGVVLTDNQPKDIPSSCHCQWTP